MIGVVLYLGVSCSESRGPGGGGGGAIVQLFKPGYAIFGFSQDLTARQCHENIFFTPHENPF